MSVADASPRAILFDIDGTLLRSRGSAGIFDDAMERVFGIRGDLRSIRPDGMTDPDILATLMNGRAPVGGAITPRLLATFEVTLARALADGVARGDVSVWTLPGVDALIAELSRRDDARLGIVTFFFNDTATTEIYTLSLHDALPISRLAAFTVSIPLL